MTLMMTLFKRAGTMQALTIGVLVLGLLSVQVGRGTMAFFTTQVASNANAFTVGNLKFNVNDNNESATGLVAVTSSIALVNMKPGDSVFAPITITNVGSLDGQWGISYTATNSGGTDVTTALKIGVVGTGSGTGVAATCTAANFATNTVFKEQILPVPEAMTNLGRKIVDSTGATGPATDGAYVAADVTGTRYLPLNHAGAATFTSDLLCVQVNFPDLGAPTSLTTQDNQWNVATAQSMNSTVVFKFDGQQRHRPVEFDQPTGGSATAY